MSRKAAAQDLLDPALRLCRPQDFVKFFHRLGWALRVIPYVGDRGDEIGSGLYQRRTIAGVNTTDGHAGQDRNFLPPRKDTGGGYPHFFMASGLLLVVG